MDNLDNLDIQHHVQIRNMLYKYQIEISQKIRDIRSKDWTSETELIQSLVRIDLEVLQLELERVRSNVASQETLINSYMNNLEN